MASLGSNGTDGVPPNLQGEPPFFYYFNAQGKCLVYYPNVTLYEVSQAGRAAGLTIFVMVLTYIWLTLALYFSRRAHPFLIKRVDFGLLFIGGLGGSILALGSGLSQYLPPDQLPCVFELLYLLIIPAWIMPLVVRYLAAMNRSRLYASAFASSLTELDEITDRFKSRSYVGNVQAAMRMLLFGKKVPQLERNLLIATLSGQLLADLVLLPFVLLVIAKVFVQTDVYRLNCFACNGGDDEFIYLISTVIIIALSILIITPYRNATDPLGELHEVRTCFAVAGIFAAFGQILPVFVPDPDPSWTFEYLTLIGFIFTHTLQVTIPVLRTIAPRNPDSAGLELVLKDPALKAEFAEFTKTELSFENIRFVDEVQQFKSDFAHDNPEARLGKAKRILNSMIVEGSALQVNIPYSMRTTLEKALGGSDKVDVEATMFDEARDEIVKLMERDSFPRFKAMMRKKSTGGSSANVLFGQSRALSIKAGGAAEEA